MTWLTTPSTAGGSFAPTQAASYFFDKLRSASVILESGVRQVQTDAARLAVPRILADASVNWTEEGTEITPSDPDADTVTATPRALKALVYASNELIADSNPDAQNVLAENLARATALKLDAGFLEGTGTAPQITGLKEPAGNRVHPRCRCPGRSRPIRRCVGLLAEADAVGPPAIVMHPRNWRAITKIKETSGSTKPVIVDGAGSPTEGVRRSVYGVPVWLTSQLSTNEGTGTNENSIYVYDTEQVVVVMRQDASVEVDGSAAFSSDRTAVRVVLRADLVLPNPAAVVRISGVTA